ncbi:MAG: tetraacyldisaccharide 4'-kinase [Cocleimonas sp.]
MENKSNINSNSSNKNKNSVQQTSRLQQWLENIWYSNTSSKRWGLFSLIPLSALYCSINRFQRFQNRHPKAPLPCPVIVVGNITVGGTGKTPLALHLVNLLKQAGYKPAIITRGYGGKATTWPQTITANSDPKMVGDEAVLMASRSQVPVYAGADRLASIEALCKAHDCDVIISDDGMQHYKLPRDIQIAVLDGSRMLGNGWCLPAGPLREKKQRLESCDFLVVNGEIAESANNKKDILAEQPFFTMNLKSGNLIHLSAYEQQSDQPKKAKNKNSFNDKKVHAVTGIGNPSRFFNALETQEGLQLITHSFPDHHDFSESDLQFDDDLPVVITEKDAVKCRQFLERDKNNNIWVLPVTAELDGGFNDAFLKKLLSVK